MNAISRRKFWKAGFFDKSAPSVEETVTLPEQKIKVETKVEEKVETKIEEILQEPIVEEVKFENLIFEEVKPKSKKGKKVVDSEE